METSILEIVQSLGLPTAMAIGLGWFLYKIISRMMENHEENLRKYQEQLDVSQTMSTNHLTHVEMYMEKMADKLMDHDTRAEKTGEKIVDSIERQTNLLIDTLKNREVK